MNQFKEILDEIRSRSNIVDIISEHTPLTKKGQRYVGLCPFHSEKTPSFSVSDQEQLFYCFGCGVGGDRFKFVMDINQCTFREAISYLAERVGLPFKNLQNKSNDQLLIAMDIAAKYYHHKLCSSPAGQDALAYLAKRKISSLAIAEFQLGYADEEPRALLEFLQLRGISLETIKLCGLIRRNANGQEVDAFSSRLMFPIRNQIGDVIAFGGRLIGSGEPKYVNSMETPLFKKRDQLYNFHAARLESRSERKIVLLEGYLDVISAWQAGVLTAVAPLGTSLSVSQSKMIKQVANKVILCYDADLAGEKAVAKSVALLDDQGCLVQVAQLHADCDPNDVLQRHGADEFVQLLSKSVPYIAFNLATLKKKYKLDNEEGRLSYLVEAVKIISMVPTAIEADHYLQLLAREFSVSLTSLKEDYLYYHKKSKAEDRIPQKGHNRKVNALSTKRPVYTAVEKAEQFLLACMLRDHTLIRLIMEQIGDAFCIDYHAVIAANIYQYVEQTDNFSVEVLVRSFADHPELVNVVTQIAMLELPPELSEIALQDYINYIKKYPTKELLKSKKQEMELLAQTDPIGAAQMGLEINKIRSELQSV